MISVEGNLSDSEVAAQAAEALFRILDNTWSTLAGDLSSRCAGTMACLKKVLAETDPAFYQHEKYAKTVEAALGSIERLQWLSQSGLEAHRYAGVFLTGSLSYGRFFSIDRKCSDIDLLIVYGDGGIAKCLMDLPETLQNSLKPDLLKNLSHIEEIDQPELYAIHLPPDTQPVEVSITAISAGLLRHVILPKPGSTISLWRDISIPMETLKLKDMAGCLVAIPYEQSVKEIGSILTVPGYLRNQDIFVPNGYQNLIMPRMEYIGRLSEEVEAIMIALARTFRAALEETRRAGFRTTMTTSHIREARMPEALRAIADDLAAAGPKSL